MSEISRKLLKQKVRNRIIEALDGFADETTVGVLGTDEIIEIWYDYNHEDDIDRDFFNEPVFSTEETAAIDSFHKLLNGTFEVIPGTWQLKDLKKCKEWHALVKEAKQAYAIFMKRGRFDEDKEISF